MTCFSRGSAIFALLYPRPRSTSSVCCPRDGANERIEPSRLCVPRTRFAPVKTTDDLFVLRSDVYTLDDEFQVEPVPGRSDNLPFVQLDPRYYKLLDAFESRVRDGPPSLREAERLVVRGDVTFEPGVVVRGAVNLEAEQPTRIAAGTVLTG